MKINILLPFASYRPVGGIKIMYEFANMLALKGHDVHIYHSLFRQEGKPSLQQYWFQKFLFFVKGARRPSWFKFHKSIKTDIVDKFEDKKIRDADVILSTWWETIIEAKTLSPSKGKPHNIIQGYEIWNGRVEEVHNSYNIGVPNFVIANYLYRIVTDFSAVAPIYLPLAIDSKKFFEFIKYEDRNPYSICMMYSEQEVKCTGIGIAALEQLRLLFPQLVVEMFGIYKQPKNIPEWIKYTFKPDNLNEIYNRNSIFVSPSKSEGWALPPAEAMISGTCVVCTNIGGHADYAIDKETAFLFEPESVQDLVDTLGYVFRNEIVKKTVAEKGKNFILNNFNWEQSVNTLVQNIKG